jgi:hypothetical protein
MRGIARPPEKLLACQKRLPSMELDIGRTAIPGFAWIGRNTSAPFRTRSLNHAIMEWFLMCCMSARQICRLKISISICSFLCVTNNQWTLWESDFNISGKQNLVNHQSYKITILISVILKWFWKLLSLSMALLCKCLRWDVERLEQQTARLGSKFTNNWVSLIPGQGCQHYRPPERVSEWQYSKYQNNAFHFTASRLRKSLAYKLWLLHFYSLA